MMRYLAWKWFATASPTRPKHSTENSTPQTEHESVIIDLTQAFDPIYAVRHDKTFGPHLTDGYFRNLGIYLRFVK